jgi:hypothetical protein
VKCDIHDKDLFGVIKMTIPEDIKHHFVVTLDQINSRFVDKENMGEYSYMYCRVMLSKITSKGKSVYFVCGDQGSKGNYAIIIPEGIGKGEYLITYRAEYNEQNTPEQKLVISTHNFAS